jgi:hypothetical protein
MKLYGTLDLMLLLRGMLCSARAVCSMVLMSLITLRPCVNRDLRTMPTKTSNAKGTLLLGYMEDGSDDEHLNIGACRLTSIFSGDF